MDIIEKDKTDIFVERYFKSLRMKQVLAIGLSFVIYNIILGKEESMMSIATAVIISFLVFSIVPDFLRKETEISIQKFYDGFAECDGKAVIICNLKKFNGPTFGALYIDEKRIEFLPLRKNLQNEGFVIGESEIKNINISVNKIKISVLNRIFFKELRKAIIITYNSKKIVLQMHEPEKAVEKIKKIYM